MGYDKKKLHQKPLVQAIGLEQFSSPIIVSDVWMIVHCSFFYCCRRESVYFLECDIGQSEFTPSGVVSLVHVTQPVFGKYLHLS